LITFLQHYLVAMATTLDKLENKVEIHHMCQAPSYYLGKRGIIEGICLVPSLSVDVYL